MLSGPRAFFPLSIWKPDPLAVLTLKADDGARSMIQHFHQFFCEPEAFVQIVEVDVYRLIVSR